MDGFRTTIRKPSEHKGLFQQLKGNRNSNTLEWHNFKQDFRIPVTTVQQESSELPRIWVGQGETGWRGRWRWGMGAWQSPHTLGRPRPPSPPAPKRCQKNSSTSAAITGGDPRTGTTTSSLDPNYYRITRMWNGRKIRQRHGPWVSSSRSKAHAIGVNASSESNMEEIFGIWRKATGKSTSSHWPSPWRCPH
jgi:hypothetical protein